MAQKTLLFLCPIFPTQFKAVVNAFAPTHKIVAACHKNNSAQIRGVLDNVTVLHELPFGGFENNLVVFGNALIQLLGMIKPDVVLMQASFGFEMLIGLLPPSVPIVGYFELWYPESITLAVGADPRRTLSAVHTNAIQSTLADRSVMCVTPTRYQRSQFPLNIAKKMLVLHEGIDTDYFKPATRQASNKKLITFVSTGLEPGKCFIQFINIVCLVMQQDANVSVEIVGNDVVLYSMYDPAYPNVKSYKQEAIDLLNKHGLLSRVIFRGSVSSAEVLDVYRRSDLHVHFTIVNPSWSLLEAMSCGCVVLASDSEILREFTSVAATCYTANHDDYVNTAKKVVSILNTPDAPIRANARQFVVDNFNASNAETKWKTLITALL